MNRLPLVVGVATAGACAVALAISAPDLALVAAVLFQVPVLVCVAARIGRAPEVSRRLRGAIPWLRERRVQRLTRRTPRVLQAERSVRRRWSTIPRPAHRRRPRRLHT